MHDAYLGCYDAAVKLKSEGLQKLDLVDAAANVLPAATVLLKLRTSVVKLAHFLQSPATSAATAELMHLLEPPAEVLKKLVMSAKIAHLLLIEVATGG